MPKADINKAGWEQSEFPILCETCTFHLSFCFPNVNNPSSVILGLGANPFIRMVCLPLFLFYRVLKIFAVQARIRSIVWHMCSSFHCLSLEPGPGCALQNYGDLPDMRQGEKRLPDLFTL